MNFLGLRRCPAEDVADMQSFLIFANFLKAFTLRTPHGDNKSIKTQYEAGTGIIRHPKPFKVIMNNRD